MTTHYKIEPKGFGRGQFGSPSLTDTNKEFKSTGFGDPKTFHKTDNAEGTGGTPAYTSETITTTTHTNINED